MERIRQGHPLRDLSGSVLQQQETGLALPTGPIVSDLPIYNEAYAARYASLYVDPWTYKHDLNVATLGSLLDALGPEPCWLDLACGPAWHFSQFPGRARMCGIDQSPAQLARARLNAPQAELRQADMAEADLGQARFDLVTCFWGAYCYLGSAARIGGLVDRAVRALRPGGALYFELLLPDALESFNASHFASHTGFRVRPLTLNYSMWAYDDEGGTHTMCSPPLRFFRHHVDGRFKRVEATDDGRFMVHLVAHDRV